MQNSFGQVTSDILGLWIVSAIILVSVTIFFLFIIVKVLKIYKLHELYKMWKETTKLLEVLNERRKETTKEGEKEN